MLSDNLSTGNTGSVLTSSTPPSSLLLLNNINTNINAIFNTDTTTRTITENHCCSSFVVMNKTQHDEQQVESSSFPLSSLPLLPTLPTLPTPPHEEEQEENEYSELNGHEWKHLFLLSCTQGDLLLFKQLTEMLDKKFVESVSLPESGLEKKNHTTTTNNNNKDLMFFDINVRDERRATGLHKACAYGHIAITRELLLRSDIDKYCVDNSFATPFHYAAASGNVVVVNLLFTHAKESLDSRDVFGNTPLLLAMQNGKLDAVRFLLGVLQTNSIRTKKSTNSRSLLHLAAVNFDIEGMKLLLLEKEEFIKERNKRNHLKDEDDQSDHDLDELMYRQCLQDMCCSPMSPQQESTLLNGENTELRLSAHGKVLIQAKEENGLTPLMLAIKEYRSMVSKTLVEKQMCLMYLLLAEMSSQNCNSNLFVPLDSMKRSALHIAAVHDCADFFRIIALMYCSESYLDLLLLKDSNGFTPLHLACKQGSINVVDTIILMCTNSPPPPPPSKTNKILSPPSPVPSSFSLLSSPTTTTSTPININQPKGVESYSNILINSPPSSPSLHDMMTQQTPNSQTSLKIVNSPDPKNRPPIFYAALALAKHCKKEKELPTHSSLDATTTNQRSTSTNSIHVLGVRGEKETFQKIIQNLISSGLVSLHSPPNSPNSTSPSKNANNSTSSPTIPSTFDLLCNETDYFEKFPLHFKLSCSPTTSNKSTMKRNFDNDSCCSNLPLHSSTNQIHSKKAARSMSSSGFSIRRKFGIFQSSSLSEDIDVGPPPSSPSKQRQ